MKAYALMNSGLPKNYEGWKFGVHVVGFIFYCWFTWVNAGWLHDALPDMLGHTLMYHLLLCFVYYHFLKMFINFLDRKYCAWRKVVRQEVIENLWEKDPTMMKMFEAQIDTLKEQLSHCDRMQEKVDEHRSNMRKEMEKLFEIISIHAQADSIIRGIREIGARRGML